MDSIWKAKYLFDNGTTVFFAVFMSLWAVFFLGIYFGNIPESLLTIMNYRIKAVT